MHPIQKAILDSTTPASLADALFKLSNHYIVTNPMRTANRDELASTEFRDILLSKIDFVVEDIDSNNNIPEVAHGILEHYCRSLTRWSDGYFIAQDQALSARYRSLLDCEQIVDTMGLVLLPRCLSRNSRKMTEIVARAMCKLSQIDGMEKNACTSQIVERVFDAIEKLFAAWSLPSSSSSVEVGNDNSTRFQDDTDDPSSNRLTPSVILGLLGNISSTEEGKILLSSSPEVLERFLRLVVRGLKLFDELKVAFHPAASRFREMIGDFVCTIGNVASGRGGCGDTGVIFSTVNQGGNKTKQPSFEIANLLLQLLHDTILVSNQTVNPSPKNIEELCRAIANIALTDEGQVVLANHRTAKLLRRCLLAVTTSKGVEMVFRAICSISYQQVDFIRAFLKPGVDGIDGSKDKSNNAQNEKTLKKFNPAEFILSIPPKLPYIQEELNYQAIPTAMSRAIRLANTNEAVEWIAKGIQNLIHFDRISAGFLLVPPSDKSLAQTFPTIVKYARSHESLGNAKVTQNALSQMAQMTAEFDSMKSAANTSFSQAKYEEALEQYKTIIMKFGDNVFGDPGTIAPLYTNCSICYFKLERYDESFQDANKACKLNPFWAKGWARKALASKELSRYRLAFEAFKCYFKISFMGENIESWEDQDDSFIRMKFQARGNPSDPELFKQYEAVKNLARTDDDSSSYDDE